MSTFTEFRTASPRGFTLFVAVIFSSVILSIGLALLDVAYKEIILSSTAHKSQFAFYNADSGLECGIYWDSGTAGGDGNSLFAYGVNTPTGTLTCEGNSITFTDPYTGVSPQVAKFSIPCPDGGGVESDVTVYKYSGRTVLANYPTPVSTIIYSTGYNTCTTGNDPNLVERGEKAYY